MIRVALTVAGSDPSGGAGIQADLKTFHRFGVYGEAVITLLTVQNTRGVTRVEVQSPDLVSEQIDAVMTDVPPHALKTGALGSAAVVRTVARSCRRWGVRPVVDPVMVSKHGATLMSADAEEAMLRELIPVAAVVTPNLEEAARLIGRSVTSIDEMRDAARLLVERGAGAALIKGGHAAGEPVDVLYADGVHHEFRAARIPTRHTHGTGCTHSAAITALLARGFCLRDAVERAKKFITRAIETNPGIGGGYGPVNHWAE